MAQQRITQNQGFDMPKVQAFQSVQVQSASRDPPVPLLQVEDRHLPSNSYPSLFQQKVGFDH